MAEETKIPPVGVPLTAETARLLLPGDVLELTSPAGPGHSKGDRFLTDGPDSVLVGRVRARPMDGGAFVAWHASRLSFVSRPTQSPETLGPSADAEGIKPCPFCGGAARTARRNPAKALWFVQCDNCDASQHGSFSEASAIATWNRRP